MIYYEDEKILIRNMKPSDAQIITDAEIAQGWSQTVDKYELRLKHQAEGRCVALVAEFEGSVAGYLNVYRSAETGSFAERGLPEIVDFGVLEKYRKRGIGNKLMDAAEEIASGYADAVTLCVGLHSGCMQNAGISPTEAAPGIVTRSARHMRSAEMMTSWFCICPSRCAEV